MSLETITLQLSEAVDSMVFGAPVTHTYNPLRYAWPLHEAYLQRFGTNKAKGRILLLGMNPGPWGMAQTGVPFGEVAAVRDWMGLQGKVGQPKHPHPKRPVAGLEQTRSEVSGRRLWGWAKERYVTPDAFFDAFFVVNYCPLIFLEEGGRNRIPEKLTKEERAKLFTVCDAALRAFVEALEPCRLIGVGGFAQKCGKRVVGDLVDVGKVLHPSPASPAANRGWAAAAERQLVDQGVVLPTGR